MKTKIPILTYSVGILILLFVITSCNSEEPIIEQDIIKATSIVNPYHISIEKALESADNMMVQISDNRTRAPRKISSVKFICEQNTTGTRNYSSSKDTLLYLVNYENDGGFVLLSADMRTKPIYAISDEGHLDLSDTIYNKGLSLFMNNAFNDYKKSVTTLSDSMHPGGSIIQPINPDITKPDIPVDHYKYELFFDCKPILKHYQSRWGQEYPFNIYCKQIDGQRCVAGCVAVAFAQLCSAHKIPSSFKGRNLDWDAINNSYCFQLSPTIDDLAYFIAGIGGKDYLELNYGTRLTSGSFNNVQSILRKLGANASEYYNYKGYIPEDAYPVMMSALGKVGDKTTGHAWILDGGYEYKITSNMYTDGYAVYHFEHCVWGWDGNANGYYSWSPRYGFGSHADSFADDDNGTSNEATGLYTYDFKYIYIK